MPKFSASALLSEIPGGIGTWYELRRSFIMFAGSLFVFLLPKRMADGIFDRLASNRRARFKVGLARDPIVERMKMLLSDVCSDTEIRACAEQYQEIRTEDLWGRWQASFRTDWTVRTDVVGLEHITNAQDQGRGVVIWGMSFCGTLFPKIALLNAGVALTQLSSADHGAWYPLTLLGKWVAGPLHCPKQNMSAITLLIYFAYFILRRSFEDPERQARIASVYNVFACAMLIPLLFVIPRLTDSLHPGSGGNPAMGGEDLDNTMRAIFYPAVLGWTLLGLWISVIFYRLKRVKYRLEY